MPSSQAPNIGINYGWTYGESGYHLEMDENLKAIDALLMVNVKSVLSAPPGSPVDGDRYLIGSSPTGAWSAHVDKIARWIGAAWEFYTAKEGWEVRAQDSLQRYHFNGTAWALESTLYATHADDTAAASGGIPVGGFYINSSSGALTARLV